jgi:hypothetical protein
LARLHAERSAFQRAEFAERELGRFGARQHRPRLRQKHASGLGQGDVASNAIEQLGVVPRFQCRDRMTRRRLRDVQRTSRLRHMLSLGHRDKDPKLIERHPTLRHAR